MLEQFIQMNQPVDGNIVTTAHYKDLGIWMKTALDLASKRC